MKKSDLKSGMVVEIRNGSLGLVLLNSSKGDIIGGCGRDDTIYNTFEGYTEDLTDVEGDFEYDIMRVYNSTGNFILGTIDILSLNLIWRRKEPQLIKDSEVDELIEEIGKIHERLIDIKHYLKSD